MNYTKEELALIGQFKELPTKQCKECEKYFPIHETFFLKEKRIKDGFENKCRKCRGGNFLTRKRKDSAPYLNKEITKQFNTVHEIYEYFIKNNTLPYRSFVLDNHLEIFKYLIVKENILIDNLNKLDREWFQDRKLYSSLLRIYNGSVFNFVNAAFPNTFKPWDFATVGRHYWEDKENRVKALKWLIEQLLNDGIINSIDEIPRKVNGNTFNNYELRSLLDDYYKHIFNAFNDVCPNKFYIWQYQQLPEGAMNSKDNRIKWLKELVEQHLKMNIDDIPKVFSYEYFNRPHEDFGYRFKTIIDKYYDSMYDYVNDVYPNVFTVEQFPYKNHYITLDNVRVRSEPERQIHHLFMRYNLNYKYGDIIGRMKIKDVIVLPDWYIYKDDKIVLVEYYGMLDTYGVDFGYNDKYIMKEQLYKQLCIDDSKYEYLALYVEDMKNNFTGVRDKLKQYNII